MRDEKNTVRKNGGISELRAAQSEVKTWKSMDGWRKSRRARFDGHRRAAWSSASVACWCCSFSLVALDNQTKSWWLRKQTKKQSQIRSLTA